MRTIAVFLPNWIGDVVMATPAIRALREHFPDARLLAVCKSYVADTLAGLPWFDDTIPFDKSGPKNHRFWGVVSGLRANRTDAAVLFPNSFRSALAARLSGCSTVVGFARYGRDILLSQRLYPIRDSRGRPKPSPIIDDYNRIVQLLGVPDPGHRMQLGTTPIDEAAANDVWKQLGLQRFSRIVGLNPGGAFGAAKHWPTAHFAELALMFAARTGTGVLVLCGPSERDIARDIVQRASHPSITTLADIPLSLGLTKAVVRRLELLVTTDSGPRHFAAAFGVNVVSLFGPTHIGWTDTFFPKEIHLQKAVPCGPCQQRTCPLGHHRCMTELTPIEVFQATERLMAHRHSDQEEHRRAS